MFEQSLALTFSLFYFKIHQKSCIIFLFFAKKPDIDGRYLLYCSKIFHHLQISLHIAGDFGLFIWEFKYRLLNSILKMLKKSRYL